ncbi:MAG: NADH-quinone oxidoreductase subunit A [Acidimicrobiia bacterium]
MIRAITNAVAERHRIATRKRETEPVCCEGLYGVLNQYYGDYITVTLFVAIGAILVGAAVGVSKLIAPRRPGGFKDIAYESGIEPVGGGWNQSHIRYYIYALLFLIFDVEVVFIFPWAIQLDVFQAAGRAVFAIVEMFAFIAILLMGLVYAIRKGVLKWE